MTTEYAVLPQDITVKDALDKLRVVAPERETIYYVYVINDAHNLLGIVSLKNLILARTNLFVKDIMDKDILRVNAFADSESASKIISDYDLLALPVVDNSNKLVGIVTVDDVVDLLRAEDTEDILHYGAVGKHINYLRSNPFAIAKQRIIWIFVLVLMGFVSAFFLQRYHDILDVVVALVFFIPLLCASGGNAGTQASTVIIRALATEEIDMKDLWSVVFKEISIGCIMGLLMGAVVAARAFFVGHDIHLSIVVGVSMLLVVILANSMGGLFPIILKKLRLDPALMCGPFIASVVDVCCIVGYFEIARFVYNL